MIAIPPPALGRGVKIKYGNMIHAVKQRQSHVDQGISCIYLIDQLIKSKRYYYVQEQHLTLKSTRIIHTSKHNSKEKFSIIYKDGDM